MIPICRYSPSGFYIASADKSGKIRIWDTVNQEHILKNEFQPIAGKSFVLNLFANVTHLHMWIYMQLRLGNSKRFELS